MKRTPVPNQASLFAAPVQAAMFAEFRDLYAGIQTLAEEAAEKHRVREAAKPLPGQMSMEEMK